LQAGKGVLLTAKLLHALSVKELKTMLRERGLNAALAWALEKEDLVQALVCVCMCIFMWVHVSMCARM